MNKATTIRQDLSMVDELFKNHRIEIQDIDEVDSQCFDILFVNAVDFRDIKRTSYKFNDMLMMILLAKLCWTVSNFSEIAAWCKTHYRDLKRLKLIKGDRTPSHDTFRRFFMFFDFTSLVTNLMSCVETLCDKVLKYSPEYKRKYKMYSVDGKDFRGSGRKEGTKNPHGNYSTLNIYELATECCLATVPLTSKDSEIPAFQELIPVLNLKNTIVTADALHCQRKTCSMILEKRGHYVFSVKANQASLYQLLTDVFTGKMKYKNPVKSVKREGRDFLIQQITKGETDDSDFPKVKYFVQMISKKHDKNNETIRYFISSVPDETATIEAIENRWEIEGKYHYFKDQNLGEDDFTSDNTKTIKNMATLNGVVYTLSRIVSALTKKVVPAKYVQMWMSSDLAGAVFQVLKLLKGRRLTKLLKENFRKKGNIQLGEQDKEETKN